MPALWDDMLDEFRALGGAAENVAIARGPLGRGLFPIDPAKPVRLRVPESLLVPLSFVRVEDGGFRIVAEAAIGAREREFLEAYERDFSWGTGHAETEELLSLLQGASAALRQLLETPFEAHAWLAGTNPRFVAERFFAARALVYNGTPVLAPVIDLVNHGFGPQLQTVHGIVLQGEFPGEIVTRYGPADPVGIFNQWGFASSGEFFALSLGLKLKTESKSLVIGRRDPVFAPGRNPFVPEVFVAGDEVTVSHVLLGHRRFPKLPRGIFYRLMREAGCADAEQTFDRLQHINRMACHQLASAAESATPPLRHLLRNLARYQLELMSYNVGASEAV